MVIWKIYDFTYWADLYDLMCSPGWKMRVGGEPTAASWECESGEI